MRIVQIIIVLGLLTAIGWWYWQQQNPPVLEVSTVNVERGSVEATVANTRAGTVKACRRAQLSPALGGQISQLPFSAGSAVQQGDILLRLWQHDLEASLTLAQRNVDASRRQKEASCLQAAEAQRAAQRAQQLGRTHVISAEALDKARTQAAISAKQCAAAEAQIAVSQAQLQVAQVQLERTVITAPFAGVIADINGEVNEYVTPSPPGIQTLPVIDLIEPGCFRVSAPIDEVDAPAIRPGLPARITLDAWRGRHFPGEVTRVGAYIIDLAKQARTVEVELRFTDDSDLDALLVGYSADVDIITATHDNVLRIPSETLLEGQYVYRLNHGVNNEKDESEGDHHNNDSTGTGFLEKRRVQTGLSNWTYTEITAGLDEQDQIVSTPGDTTLKDGIPARSAVNKTSP